MFRNIGKKAVLFRRRHPTEYPLQKAALTGVRTTSVIVSLEALLLLLAHSLKIGSSWGYVCKDPARFSQW